MATPIGLNTNNGVGNFLQNPFTRSVNNSIRQDDFPAGFVIQELDSENGLAELEKIPLLGNFMPKVPFTYGGNQRLKKTYYPGNEEASIQVLGATENDLVISGRFYSKKFAGKSVDLTTTFDLSAAAPTPGSDKYTVPFQLAQALTNMRRRGNIVQITMGTWKRFAVISLDKFDIKNLGDIDYELTFSIISHTLPSKCPIIAQTKLFPTSLKSNLASSLTDLQAEAKTIPTSIPASTADLINSAISALATPVNAVIGFIDGIVSAGEDITDSINRAVGVVKNAKAEVSRTRTRLGRISYNLDFAGVPVPDALRASNIVSGNISVSNDISDILAKLQRQFERIKETTPKARHLVQEQDTLRKISNVFFGNPDGWKLIYDHNRFSVDTKSTGQLKLTRVPTVNEIVIPEGTILGAEFITTSPTLFISNASEAFVNVEAVNPGIDFNYDKEAFSFVQLLENDDDVEESISGTNSTPTIGGRKSTELIVGSVLEIPNE